MTDTEQDTKQDTKQDTPNQHTENFLEDFIKNENVFEYGVLLSGKWGSGKTFFIDNFKKEQEEKYKKQKENKIEHNIKLCQKLKSVIKYNQTKDNQTETKDNQTNKIFLFADCFLYSICDIINDIYKLVSIFILHIRDICTVDFIINIINDKNKSPKEPIFIKINLFSLNSIEEINDHILTQLYSTNSSIRYIILNIIETLYFKLFRPNTSNKTLLNNLKKSIISQNKYNLIYIFDDLERTKLDITIVLGYINELILENKQKVIILANEDKIYSTNNKLASHNELGDYTSFKEKLIGKTFEIEQDFGSIYDSFLTTEGKSLSSIAVLGLKDNKNNIKQIFEASKYNNLRLIKYIIEDFEYLYKKIEDKIEGEKDNELINEFIKAFFILSIELKSNNLDKDLFLNYDLERMLGDDFRKNNNEDSEKIDKILDKYKPKHIYSSSYIILNNSEWIELICFNYLSDNDTVDLFKRNPVFDEDWYKLYHYFTLEDEEFSDILGRVSDNFFDNEYNNIDILGRIIQILLHLSDLKLHNCTKKKIKKKAISNISLLNTDSLQEVCGNYILYADSLRIFSAGVTLKEFKKVKTILEEKKEDLEKDLKEASFNNTVNNFMSSINKSDISEIKSILVDYKYFIPIFSKIKPVCFIEAIIKLNNNDLTKFIKLIKLRYGKSSKFDSLEKNEKLKSFEKELDFWEEFLNELKDPKFESKYFIEGQIKKTILKDFQEIIERIKGYKV